jgi:hypothetical protein
MNGTAFWLHNPVLVAALWGLVARRFDPWIRAAAAFAFVAIGAGILMYESGGWVQFGFRYVIDLLPAGFVVFAFAFDRFPRLLLVASLVTFALNIYGLAGWKHFPRQPRDAPWLQGLPAASPPPDLGENGPGGGPPHHAADGDHVRQDRRPHVTQTRPEEGGHAGERARPAARRFR